MSNFKITFANATELIKTIIKYAGIGALKLLDSVRWIWDKVVLCFKFGVESITALLSKLIAKSVINEFGSKIIGPIKDKFGFVGTIKEKADELGARAKDLTTWLVSKLSFVKSTGPSDYTDRRNLIDKLADIVLDLTDATKTTLNNLKSTRAFNWIDLNTDSLRTTFCYNTVFIYHTVKRLIVGTVTRVIALIISLSSWRIRTVLEVHIVEVKRQEVIREKPTNWYRNTFIRFWNWTRETWQVITAYAKSKFENISKEIPLPVNAVVCFSRLIYSVSDTVYHSTIKFTKLIYRSVESVIIYWSDNRETVLNDTWNKLLDLGSNTVVTDNSGITIREKSFIKGLITDTVYNLYNHIDVLISVLLILYITELFNNYTGWLSRYTAKRATKWVLISAIFLATSLSLSGWLNN